MTNTSSLRNAKAISDEKTHHHIIYLACPYTDPNPEVRKSRFEAATKAAAKLIGQGHIVYSPITMTHPIDVVLAGSANTLGSDYWVTFDEAFMEICSEIVVLQLDGWEKSNGVAREVAYFNAAGKSISYMPAPNSRFFHR